MQDIGAVDDLKRLADIVIRDQHAKPALFQIRDQRADIAHCNRVNAREGFIQQHIARGYRPLQSGQRPRRVHPAAHSAG